MSIYLIPKFNGFDFVLKTGGGGSKPEPTKLNNLLKIV